MAAADGAPTRRWLVVAVTAAVLVAGAAALPRVLGDRDGPAPPAATSTACVSETDATAEEIAEEIGEQEATWVRFCPLAEEGLSQRLRHPQGVVTGTLAASVAETLWDTQVGRRVCTPGEGATSGPTGLFRIEVGLSDGRVAELRGDTGCSTRDLLLFSQLESTLLMAAAGEAGEAGVADPVRCPTRFTSMRTNHDGTTADALVETAGQPWQSTVPLLPLPATTADVCAYRGTGRDRELVAQWQVASPRSETIRATTATAIRLGARADCALAPDATSYLVVLTDAAGTARSLTIDPTRCSPVTAAIGTPPVETSLGLALPRLVRAVARSRP